MHPPLGTVGSHGAAGAPDNQIHGVEGEGTDWIVTLEYMLLIVGRHGENT